MKEDDEEGGIGGAKLKKWIGWQILKRGAKEAEEERRRKERMEERKVER